jgi:hypothetical protein
MGISASGVLHVAEHIPVSANRASLVKFLKAKLTGEACCGACCPCDEKELKPCPTSQAT